MMIDRTSELRQVYNQLRAKLPDKAAKPSILPPITLPSLLPFTASAQQLLHSIQQLNTLLTQSKRDYLNVDKFLSVRASEMTAAERGQFESCVAAAIRTTDQQIDELKSSIHTTTKHLLQDDPTDCYQHQQAIVLFLFQQLQRVAQRMAELKSQRLALERQEATIKKPPAFQSQSHYDAAFPEKSRGKDKSSTNAQSSTSQSRRHSNCDVVDKKSNFNQRSPFNDADDSKDNLSVNPIQTPPLTGNARRQRSSMLDNSKSPKSMSFDPSIHSSSANNTSSIVELSAEEQFLFEQENAALKDQLQDQLDQALQTESKMNDISNLLTLFATKVTQQEEQINTIYDTTIESTLHVKRGVEQLKTAGKRNVNTRIMMLFTILVLSFSLLFLDWYSTG